MPALRTIKLDPSKCIRFSLRLDRDRKERWFRILNKAGVQAYRRNRCDVLPNEAVQWIPNVVKVTEPFPGLVRMSPLFWLRVILTRPSAAWTIRKPLISYISLPSLAQLCLELAITSCAFGTKQEPRRESLGNAKDNLIWFLSQVLGYSYLLFENRHGAVLC